MVTMSGIVDNIEFSFSLRPALEGTLALSSQTTLCASCLLSASRRLLVAGFHVRGLDGDNALAIDSKWRLDE